MVEHRRRRLRKPPLGNWIIATANFLEPHGKTWQPAPVRAMPPPPDTWPLSAKALKMPAPTQTMPATAQEVPGTPVNMLDPSSMIATDAPPIFVFDRPEEGAQQLAALAPSSPHPIPLANWLFPTVQHLYECARFEPAKYPQVFEYIRNQPTAAQAMYAASQYAHYRRPNYTEAHALATMRAATALKFALYLPLADLLLQTGMRQLWFASDPTELFLNAGNSTEAGRNEYGRLLQDLRTRLHIERQNGYQDVLHGVLALIPPSNRMHDVDIHADGEEGSGEAPEQPAAEDNSGGGAAKNVRFAEPQEGASS